MRRERSCSSPRPLWRGAEHMPDDAPEITAANHGVLDTALDDVLPVSMKLPQRKDTPSVAVALIIEDLETQSNVNTSKVAGEGVIKLLTPADQVAVNDAGGTDSPGGGWAVPMQYVVNKAAIDRAIDTKNPVDPMSYKPALTAAYNALQQQTNARIKHII